MTSISPSTGNKTPTTPDVSAAGPPSEPDGAGDTPGPGPDGSDPSSPVDPGGADASTPPAVAAPPRASVPPTASAPPASQAEACAPAASSRPAKALPVLQAATPQRSDASRNRRLLLEAAAALVEEVGVDRLSTDAVAQRAGVGKGTVFRHFGSRSGLMLELLDHSERHFQNAYMFGPAPLGPPADARTRLLAFGPARLALVEVQARVQQAVEQSSEMRFTAPPYLLAIRHLSILLRDAGVMGDVTPLAYALMSPLEAGLVLHQTERLGMSIDHIAAAWIDLASGILDVRATGAI